MARIPKLDAAGKFLAADVNAQIDARTKATMRADLPALAKELKIGGGMPEGGQPGQVLTTGTDGKAAWQTPVAASAIKVGGVQPASGWWLDSGNVYVTPTPDTVPPVAGTLTVTTTSSKATLTVSGASDDRALNAAPYSFSKDNGTTWTAWQTDPTYQFTGLASSTSFTFRHRVRDAAGNIKVGTAVVKSTATPPTRTCCGRRTSRTPTSSAPSPTTTRTTSSPPCSPSAWGRARSWPSSTARPTWS